jgi:methylated-DNA-[protein]-cysteine S-methyltransferase
MNTTIDRLYRRQYDSPVGPLDLVASDKGLRALLWPDHRGAPDFGETEDGIGHPVLVQATAELDEYFAGQRQVFSVSLDLLGTPFQLQVWERLRAIAYGSTSTYGELAEGLGDPDKARAVGLANGRNPVSIIVPCHRVVGADGSLTGFAGGLEVKSHLLQLEQRHAGQQVIRQGELFG